MEDTLTLPDGHLIPFPVFVIVHEAEMSKGRGWIKRGGIAVLTDATRGVYLPVFTDETFAKKVIEVMAVAGKKAGPLDDRDSLWAVLKTYSGFHGLQVAFDPNNKEPPDGRFFPIAEVIERLGGSNSKSAEDEAD